jgi:P-type Ca2+ transporter type 2C
VSIEESKDQSRKDYYTLSVEDVLASLDSSHNGLSSSRVQARRESGGYNVLPEKPGRHPVFLFFAQFKSVLIYILLAAAVISYIFDHHIDAYVIITIVILNAVMGFVQEYRAEKAIEALKKAVVYHAKVYRDGELVELPSRELVVGDYVFLEEGRRIPADIRLVEVHNFQTVESSLTGESLPVDKSSEPLSGEVTLADMINCAWTGTYVAKGHAKGVVTAIGKDTALGEIASALENIDIKKSHFQEKADILAKQMGAIAVGMASVVFLVGYFVRGFEIFEIFLFTVASLVSGIPEGLPAIFVVVLALGAWRMSKQNAIVRSLAAVETLGVVDVVITDKTGTLTQNTMTVERIVLPRGGMISVTGNGWSSEGNFSIEGESIDPFADRDIAKLVHVSGLSTTSRVYKEEGNDLYSVVGDPTEAALVVLAKKAGFDSNRLYESEKILDEAGFSSTHKARGTLLELVSKGDSKDATKKEIYIAGAPEEIIARCCFYTDNGEIRDLDDYRRERILEDVFQMSKDALRTIALAHKEVGDSVSDFSFTESTDLILDGVVGMKDPVRPEVPEAIKKAKGAGIRVVMATGDHKATAYAIAKEIGLVSETDDMEDVTYTESEIDKLSDDELQQVSRKALVFARLSPMMKLRLAEAFKRDGHIIAMTGDGVNDAPVLKRADVGIAMGNIGTDVAREASQVVLTDDNFATIISAIEEGRVVFVNTRQAGSFLVTTNFAEHGTILLTLILGLPLPLIPIQILWLNLVTDGVSGVPLAAEPSHHDVLSEPPRKKSENILSPEIIPLLLLMVFTMAGLTLFVFSHFLGTSLEKARTGAFAIMTFTQLFNVLNMRSLHRSVFSIGLFSNRAIVIGLCASVLLQIMVFYTEFFQRIFQFVPLSATEFITMIILSSSVLWLGELYKVFNSFRIKRRSFFKARLEPEISSV